MMPLGVGTLGRLIVVPEVGLKSTVPPGVGRLRLGMGLPPEAPNTRLDAAPLLFTVTAEAPLATRSVPMVSVVPAELPLSVILPPKELIVVPSAMRFATFVLVASSASL